MFRRTLPRGSEPQAGGGIRAQIAARLPEPAACLDALVVVEQGPPQPERDLRRVIELASTDPEVEDTVKLGATASSPRAETWAASANASRSSTTSRSSASAAAYSAHASSHREARCSSARVGQVCRGDGFHFLQHGPP